MGLGDLEHSTVCVFKLVPYVLLGDCIGYSVAIYLITIVMAQDTLEFKNYEDLKHLMQQAVADDFIRDYESSIKGGIRARKVYTWFSNICSIAILATSFVSGITTIVSDDTVVQLIAGIATLSVVPMERAKAYADNKFKEVTKTLAATYAKSNLNTFGVYDMTDGPGRRRAVA